MHFVEHAPRILRRQKVEEGLGVSRSTIYGWLNPQSSQYLPEFPKPIRLGKSAVGWREDEILEFIESRSRCRHQKAPGKKEGSE